MRLRRGESRGGTSAGRGLGPAMKNPETDGFANGGLRELRHHESGQTTVIMTLFLATFLFGFIAMGVDVEMLFHAKRQAQAAADAAAIAAAEETPDFTNEQNAAWAVAALNGFDHLAPVNPATVTPSTPVGGNYNGDVGSIQVVVSQPIRTFFAGIITHNATMVVSARAVAKHGLSSPTCVCLESTVGLKYTNGTDLLMNNGSTLNGTSCGTTVDSAGTSAVQVYGGATLGGLSIGSVSKDWDTTYATANVHDNSPTQGILAGTKVVEGISSSCSPPVPVPPTYSGCTADPTGGAWGNYVVGPSQSNGVICYNSLAVGANGAGVNLKPGVYVINGGTLEFFGRSVNGVPVMSNSGGNGVTFYLVGNAKLVIDQGANVNLTAPTTGTYANIVILQDSGDTSVPRAADTQPISFQGGALTSFTGEIFAPTSDVTLGNGSNTSINAEIIASTLTMNGGGTLNSTAQPNLGTYGPSVAKLIE